MWLVRPLWGPEFPIEIDRIFFSPIIPGLEKEKAGRIDQERREKERERERGRGINYGMRRPEKSLRRLHRLNLLKIER